MDYRVYFHKRNGDDPVVWSVDEGTQASEIHVQGYTLNGVCAYSQVNLEAKPGEPGGWILVQGAFREINAGVAQFFPRKDVRLG